MGFLFVDGFDHYTSLPGKWDTWSGSDWSIGAYGRFSTNGAKNILVTRYLQKNFGVNAATVYIGLAWKQSTTSLVTTIFKLFDGSTAHCGLGTDASGRLIAFRSSTATVIGTSTLALSINTWYYIEAKVTINDSGVFQVKVDGVEWISDAARDTNNAGNAYCNTLRLGSGVDAYGVDMYYDDLYVHDSAFQGDVRILTQFPSGAGNYTQWDASSSVANYACVDESAPNTTDYVSTSVVDEIDSYAMGDISPSAGTVKAVVGNYYVQKTDAGNRQLDMLTRLSSTDLLTGSPKAIPSSWAYLQFIQETKPGGGAWSVQNTKDAEMGMKLEV